MLPPKLVLASVARTPSCCMDTPRYVCFASSCKLPCEQGLRTIGSQNSWWRHSKGENLSFRKRMMLHAQPSQDPCALTRRTICSSLWNYPVTFGCSSPPSRIPGQPCSTPRSPFLSIEFPPHEHGVLPPPDAIASKPIMSYILFLSRYF